MLDCEVDRKAWKILGLIFRIKQRYIHKSDFRLLCCNLQGGWNYGCQVQVPTPEHNAPLDINIFGFTTMQGVRSDGYEHNEQYQRHVDVGTAQQEYQQGWKGLEKDFLWHETEQCWG